MIGDLVRTLADRVRQWWRRDYAYAVGRIYELSREDVDRIVGERIEDPKRAFAHIHEAGWQRFR